jgi:anaerobic selenocysteine-containing dehydrogenase
LENHKGCARQIRSSPRQLRGPYCSTWFSSELFSGVSFARETPTARQGDLHLQLKPGTDVALANAMLHVLIEENLIYESFIGARTNGWEETKALAARYTPQVAAEITGVPAEKIVKAAQIYGRAKTSMVLHARGIEHHSHGVNNVLSYINLVLATGSIGAPGRGYGTITGQGNGQGGRELGAWSFRSACTRFALSSCRRRSALTPTSKLFQMRSATRKARS